MNIEEFVKYYFPHLQTEDTKEHQALLEMFKPGRQITLWWRSRGDEALKYRLSLSSTVFALLEGKSVLLVGKFAKRVIDDLKQKYNIDVTSETKKMGVVIKAKID